MSFQRRRVALACTYCRHRKRRCDAAKPSCRTCIEAEVECHYDEQPSQRIDTSGGSREILNRLREIETLLHNQAQTIAALLSDRPTSSRPSHLDFAGTSPQSHHSSLPSQGPPPPPPLAGRRNAASSFSYGQWPLGGVAELDADLASLPPLTIPVQHRTSSSYLLSLPAMKALIGDYPTDLFFLLETRNPLPPELSLEGWSTAGPALTIDRATTDFLVSTFFLTVHGNHPILDEDAFRAVYARFLERGPDASVESTLCLVVFALGAVASVPLGSRDFRHSPPGVEYMRHALPVLVALSSWSFSYSILLPQALVLASVYFAYVVRPLHSWRMIYSASTILQFKLSGLDNRQDEDDSREAVLRLYWSCFLIECDRLAELELPRSGLQHLSDETSLPACRNLDSRQSTCYLAEISIRRLLNRIHNSLYPRRPHVLALSSTALMAPDEVTLDEITSMVAVCDELYRQLELWHASIPEPYRPPLTPLPPEGATDGGDYDHDDDDDRQAVLRIRYFAARHIIHRPFLLYIAANGVSQVAPSIVEKAGLCVESCRLYLHNTARILQKPSPYTWTFALSSLGAIVVLTLASLSPDLRHFVADIDELQSLAIRNIRPWAVSSLEVVVSILEDMQRKQRILSRV